jgi:hypothetical protein
MATILKAGNVATGAQITSDATGILEVRTGTGAGTTAITVGTDQAVAIGGNNISAVNSLGFRNRIINGDMRIDQRNAGASVTPSTASTAYVTVDRWKPFTSQGSKYSLQQNAGSVTPPAGFGFYLGVTSLSAYSITSTDYFALNYRIEGFNTADLNWGTANAQTVTLSFWIQSSLTGTFGGSILNSAENYSYPFSYTISSANTWEYKTITIAGPTAGTWVGATNGIGMQVFFGMGVGSTYSGTAGAWASSGFIASATGATSVVGTNGATFYITGVQLEAGSVATPFERRDYGRELIMAQRYYYKNFPNLANTVVGNGFNGTTTVAAISGAFPVQMRARPTALEQSGTAGDYSVAHGATSTTCSSVPTFDAPTTQNIYVVLFTVASGLTAGQGCQGRTNATGFLAWSAEL